MNCTTSSGGEEIKEEKPNSEEASLVFEAANSGQHTWIIHDAETISEIFSAENGVMFESESFEMCNLRWTLQLYPNGGNEASQGSVMIRLRLLSQSFIQKIQIICAMQCNVTLSCSTYEAMLTTECGWIARVLLLKEWVSAKPHFLSVTVSIQIIKLLFSNSNNQNLKHLLLSQLRLNHRNSNHFRLPRKSRFEYKLSKEIISVFEQTYFGKRFESLIFGANMWRLVIYPKNWSKEKQSQMYIGLHLCCAPVYAKGVNAKYWITVLELPHKKWHKTVDFTYKSPTSGSGKFIALNEIRSLECVTFEICVEILSVIPSDDTGVDSEIMTNVWNPKQIKYILATQIVCNHETGSGDWKSEIKKLKKQIRKQEQTIQILSRQNGDNNERIFKAVNNNGNTILTLIDDMLRQIPKFTL